MTSSKKDISRRTFVRLGSGMAASLAFGEIPLAAAGPKIADVIVIGAGSFGCNTAWHLREMGLSVVVVEAAKAPATFTTHGAAGFVSSWSSVHVEQWGQNEWYLQRYGIDFYTRLARSTSQEIGFGATGIAYVYLTKSGWGRVQPRAERARGFGTKLESLTPSRAATILPQIRFDSVAGILFDADSVRVRAGDAIAYLAQVLDQKGVQFRFNTRVESLLRSPSGMAGIATEQGELWATAVVVTAGAACRALVEKGCGACPAVPKPSTRYTTKPIPGITPDMPMLIFSDHHGLYIREEHGGLLIGGNELAEEVRGPVRQVENVMPTLKYADIANVTGGLPTYTPDTLFILDQVPSCKGIYVIAGCQEAGITHGPGLGKMMAELVSEGQTTWDRSSYRLDRFRAEATGL
jgi:glycine/D-amino acid oxidase-like deaminating enzyme